VETGAISTASPANQSDTQRKCPFYPQKSPPMADFCELAIVSRLRILVTFGTKTPKVSGHMPEYSHFRETATGDCVARLNLPAEQQGR
jgi:hypothetical protein